MMLQLGNSTQHYVQQFIPAWQLIQNILQDLHHMQ
jgi:hypothetical protein